MGKYQTGLADSALEIHDLADEDTRKLSTEEGTNRIDSRERLKEQELEQLSQQVETAVARK